MRTGIGGGHVDAEVQLVDAPPPVRCSPGASSSQLLVGVRARLVDDLDALVEQRRVHELDLLGGEIDLGEDLGDVLRR